MTETELVSHPDFIAFCEAWERDERCPLGLIDWLMDRDMELQAERAKWAYMRLVEGHDVYHYGYCRPRPVDDWTSWRWVTGWFHQPWAADAPGCDAEHRTYPAAIAHLLFHLDLDQAAKVAPAPPFALECVA